MACVSVSFLLDGAANTGLAGQGSHVRPIGAWPLDPILL